jgi:phage terminase large subunit-like protein
MDNLTVEMDAAENVKPSKKLARERIDLAVALIMTLESATAVKPKRRTFSTILDLQDRVRESTNASAQSGA